MSTPPSDRSQRLSVARLSIKPLRSLLQLRMLTPRERAGADRRTRAHRVSLVRFRKDRLATDRAVAELLAAHVGTVLTGNGNSFVSSGGMKRYQFLPYFAWSHMKPWSFAFCRSSYETWAK